MKKMKKLLSMLLTVIMVLAMAAPSFADEPTTGSITIENARDGQTYSIYQIFELKSYNNETGSYKIIEEWRDFIGKYDSFMLDENGYLISDVTMDEEEAKAFAKAALDFAKDNEINPTYSTKEVQSSSVTFTDVNLGYYLIDSTTGTLCALDTTNPTINIKEKNEAPTIKKELTYQGDETVSIDDNIEYTITIMAQSGAQNYVVHDIMSKGLTFNNDVNITKGGKVVDGAGNYTVMISSSDDCSFEIIFTPQFCDTITEETELKINYSAKVNPGAITVDKLTNKATLKYGEESDLEVTPPTPDVESHTYSFGLMKTTTKDVLLNGAKFKLYTMSEEANDDGEITETYTEVPVVKDGENYRKAVSDETGVDIEAGLVVIDGLKNGTYYLKEISAPDGYNKITEYASVEIKNADNNVETKGEGETKVYVRGGVQVINNTGALLPSTGGIGTTIFYAAGIILMAGAVFFVVRRKRA